MEKIDISKLQGNQPAMFGIEPIPYGDKEKNAQKVNEIVEKINKLETFTGNKLK